MGDTNASLSFSLNFREPVVESMVSGVKLSEFWSSHYLAMWAGTGSLSSQVSVCLSVTCLAWHNSSLNICWVDECRVSFCQIHFNYLILPLSLLLKCSFLRVISEYSKEKIGFGVGHGFQFWPYHLTALWSWIKYLTCLRFSLGYKIYSLLDFGPGRGTGGQVRN